MSINCHEHQTRQQEATVCSIQEGSYSARGGKQGLSNEVQTRVRVGTTASCTCNVHVSKWDTSNMSCQVSTVGKPSDRCLETGLVRVRVELKAVAN